MTDSPLTTSLWSHQQAGLEYLRANPRALLGFDMGTGKTLTTIARIAELPRGSNVLIVCPLAVIPTWPAEFEKHVNRMAWPYQILPCLRGTGKKKADRVIELFRTAPLHHSKIIVVNYETARAAGMEKTLLGVDWDLVVFDESHKVKSASGKSSKFCAKLRAPMRLALTGTPMPHSPLDIFGQARAIGLGTFGKSYFLFRARYAVFDPKPIYRAGKVVPGAKTVVGFKNLDRFKQRLATFMIQVKAEDVLDLPDKRDVEVPVELTAKERRAYNSMERSLIAEVQDGTIAAGNALGKLLKLAQMTGGYCLDEDGDTLHVGDSKRSALKEILDGLPPDEPVVVFARFRSDIRAVHEVCAELERESCELSGVENNLEQWKEGKGNVIVVQIQSGGAGIDLTRACKAVYYSVSFSMGDYDQSRARIHRPGQERKVTYFHLAA